MRESVYGRRRGDFGVLQKPGWGMRRGDSSTEGIKTVEEKGADKAEGKGWTTTPTRLESESSSAAAAGAPTLHTRDLATSHRALGRARCSLLASLRPSPQADPCKQRVAFGNITKCT